MINIVVMLIYYSRDILSSVEAKSDSERLLSSSVGVESPLTSLELLNLTITTLPKVK